MSRVHHPRARVEVDEQEARDAFVDDEAEVWIDSDTILVSYSDEDGIVIFDGVPEAPSGFRLSARSRPWRAFLRAMADAPGVFEGRIEALDESFAWRVTLDPGPASSSR